MKFEDIIRNVTVIKAQRFNSGKGVCAAVRASDREGVAILDAFVSILVAEIEEAYCRGDDNIQRHHVMFHQLFF